MNLNLSGTIPLFLATILVAACTESEQGSVSQLPSLGACENPWSSVTRGDVDGDALVDDVYLGVCDSIGSVLVDLNSVSGAKRQHELRFSIGGDDEPGICGPDVELSVRKRSSVSLGSSPQGYEGCPDCVEIQVSEFNCDPLQVYWDRTDKKLAWWR